VARPSATRGSSLTDDCLFCRLATEGDHVARTEGFYALRDIAPKADVHLLVIPDRHIESLREAAELSADEAKRMLEFVAEVARDAGLEDYRVIANTGPGAGQAIFHLHWHVLGGRMPAFG
jgi:histidine triad (HIT) family protein